jgi:Tfp pilus assembly protein PilX
MKVSGPPRDRQRGNSLLLSLIVLSSLATLGGLTVVSVQSSLKASTNDRSQTIAVYAAESGGAAAMNFLRLMMAAGPIDWTPFLNTTPTFAGNNVQPDATGNPFSADQNAWYVVKIVNNRNELSGNLATDTDRQVIIRSTGHGPLGSLAIIEWEVRWDDAHNGLSLLGWHIVL